MSIKVYEFKRCTTCQKAIKFLDAKKAKFERLPIVEQPPSLSELKKMLQYIKSEGGTFKKLFNTSGELYRTMKIGEKLKAGLSEKEALELLSKHGKMIKRPFILTPHGGTVGFNPETWSRLLQASEE